MTRHVQPVADDAHEAYSESARIAKAPNPVSLRSSIGYASIAPAHATVQADPRQIAAVTAVRFAALRLLPGEPVP
jgi:hypothetical protein